MAEYLGNINTLPELRLPLQDRKPSIVHTRAIDNCDLFGSSAPPPEEPLNLQSKPVLDSQSRLGLPTQQQKADNALIANNADSYIQNLVQKFNNFYDKTKNKINTTLPKAEEEIVKLANRKWAFLINPNPQPTPQFPINVEGLTPKMKKALVELYEYAQKELGIKILVNDAARTEKQQQLVKNGAKCSPHVKEMAVDIHVDGKSIEEAQPYLKKLAVKWKKITSGKGRWGGDWYGKQHDPWHYDYGTPVCS